MCADLKQDRVFQFVHFNFETKKYNAHERPMYACVNEDRKDRFAELFCFEHPTCGERRKICEEMAEEKGED